MPQFDIITLGAQIFGLFISLTLFYYKNITLIIPNFISTEKFRSKKLSREIIYLFNKKKVLSYKWYNKFII